jgi:hypothetical protein
VALEPKFVLAWDGIAIARAYRGDYKGAYEAYEKQKAGALVPPEKFGAMVSTALIAFAEDKLPQALAGFDAIEKDPEAKNLPIYAFGALSRAFVLTQAGKAADATKWYATALQRSEALAGGLRLNLQRGHRLGVLRNAVLSGKPAADADKLVAAAQQDLDKHADDKRLQSEVAYARGLAAWAKSGPKDAIAELSKCDPEVVVCRFDLAAAQRKTGDAAGADATEKALREAPRRDAAFMFIWTHLGKK